MIFNEEPLPPTQKLSFAISAFGGINQTGDAGGGEFSDCENMTSDQYPFASPRKPREIIKSGISNPQKLFFCGDKLAYLDGGVLFVQNGYDFSEVGTVGTVSTVVPWDNQKTLFYPADKVYNYETNTLETVSDYIQKVEGSISSTYSGGNPTDSFSQNDENVIVYKASERKEIVCASFVLEDDGSMDILPTALLDDEGDPILDKNGFPTYSKICIQVAGNSPEFETDITKKQNRSYMQENHYFMSLFVHAWDASGNTLTPARVPVSSLDPDNTDWYEFSFGQPLVFDHDAAKIHIQVAYYKAYRVNFDTISGLMDYQCLSQRDSDRESNNYKVWIESSEYPAPNTRPLIDYACMDNNRVVAVQGNHFYACNLGDYTEWSDFVDEEGNPNPVGSYTEDLNTVGDFNGIIKYNSNVIITKPDEIYTVFGNKPPYRIRQAAASGVLDGRTLAEVDGCLYYLGRDGIYRFAGGIPQKISNGLTDSFYSGIACGCNGKYYACLNDGTRDRLFVYDTKRGLWHIEDDLSFVDFAVTGGIVYGMTADGEIYRFGDGQENFKWSMTTRRFDYNTEHTKNIAKIYCRLRLYGQSWVDVYIRSNNQPEWWKFANYKAEGENVFQAKAKLKKCDWFQLRIDGVGQAEVMDIYADARLGTQKHRSGTALSKFRRS